MEYIMFINILLFAFCFDNFSFAQVDDADDDNCYSAAFTQGITGCSDFENKVFLCDLNAEMAPENDEGKSGGMILSGQMEFLQDIDEEHEIELNVWKDLPAGKQYMYGLDGNLCDSLKQTDTPWRPLAEALQTTECPIAKGVYPVERMIMSLDFAESVLNHEFVGIYLAKLCVTKGAVIEACYEIGLEVEEKPCDSSE